MTALISGAKEIGVTAFQPDAGVDTGPIYARASFHVEHPMRIETALQRQAGLMAQLAVRILEADSRGAPLEPQPQTDDGASYSIWRDEQDYALDLTRGAEELVRSVYALGHPYPGARVSVDGQMLTVLDAETVPDLPFALRDVGKVWRLDEDGPVVICGSGLIKFTRIVDETGAPWRPSRLRLRFA